MARYEKNMSLWEHLEELRWTLFKILVVLVVTTGISLGYTDEIMRFILLPVEAAQAANPEFVVKTIMTSPFDGVMIKLKVSLLGGLVVASPFVLYFIWSFVSSGLEESENKAFVWICFTGSLAFVAGMYCAHLIAGPVLSLAVRMGLESVENYWTLRELVSFMFYWLVGGGIVFELPLAMVILCRLGIIEVRTLRKARLYFYVGAFVVAAFLTPPDPLTMIIVAIPLIFLFELGMLAAAFTGKKKTSDL